MRNLQIPWPQPLPDDRSESQWREEVLEIFFDAVDARVPAAFTQITPKVSIYLFLKLKKT